MHTLCINCSSDGNLWGTPVVTETCINTDSLICKCVTVLFCFCLHACLLQLSLSRCIQLCAIVFFSCCFSTDTDDAATQGETGKVGKNNKQHIGFRMGSLQSTGSGLIGTGHAPSGLHPDTPSQSSIALPVILSLHASICAAFTVQPTYSLLVRSASCDVVASTRLARGQWFA